MNNLGVNLPISSNILLRIFEKRLARQNSVQDLSICMQDDLIRFSGVAKKLIFNMNFEIDLKPIHADKRVLYFQIDRITPLNLGWLKSKIFNRPPFLHYKKNTIRIDLNCIDRIRDIPVGNVKGFKVNGDKLWVKLGM
ncbi:hypothetical protein SAMN05216232_1101 [Virgibacillus subterraneus]|uniref:Uncharacterized protein n=2 Tax=Virgibacillus TaxID=84406 RepID=A0A1H0Z2T0_9BACI|nr:MULTISPECIES: hypothetical protein [Virgibacillus]SDQ21396.1 hypothetical protein SAMN05216231_0977 [Virgibacillus salinus]SEP85644.1 hypothetical protein SAMN05216232_1101 [Virgibacillus subterraneus]